MHGAAAKSPTTSLKSGFLKETFEELVGHAERLGTNRGNPAVIGLYRRWIEAQTAGSSHLFAAWFNIGAELNYAGDVDAAMVAYNNALNLRPNFASAAINLGLLLERRGDTGAALFIWAKATQSDESRISLINHQARLLEQNGRLEEAERCLRNSLLTIPDQPDVIQHWVHIRQKMCLWPIMSDVIPDLSVEQLVENCGPLAALALFDKASVQTEISAKWVERKTSPTPIRLSPERGYRHKRIRIGYLSSDFCRHAMSFLIAELFERHDRDNFEIFGYCSTIEDHSDIRRRVVSAFDHFRSIIDLSDEAAARLIRHDEIDLLVDLNGLTRGARLQILRWRPAPVQATYLGFVGPVPVPELDYLFCDSFVVPPSIKKEYRPRPLYIASNYQANDGKREIGHTISRTDAGLPEFGFVFCCFSNHYKITKEMFTSWMKILDSVDNSWLWLISDNQWSRNNLQKQAAAFGIDPNRLIFMDRVGTSDYMARLAVADLFLDTFPYNAGTIASDSIRMGLPLLTLSGESFASRMAGSLLTAVGATAGVKSDFDSYVETATDLATNPLMYRAYKSNFTEEKWSATIGDIGCLTRQIEGSIKTVIHLNNTGS